MRLANDRRKKAAQKTSVLCLLFIPFHAPVMSGISAGIALSVAMPATRMFWLC